MQLRHFNGTRGGFGGIVSDKPATTPASARTRAGGSYGSETRYPEKTHSACLEPCFVKKKQLRMLPGSAYNRSGCAVEKSDATG